MNTKIEFPKNSISESKQLINQTSAGSSFNQNLYSKPIENSNLKAFKIVKGKVKMLPNNNELKFEGDYLLDEETELQIVWKRMILFVKLTFLFLLFFSLFMML